MTLGIIYMAAGNSRRFGTNKLLYPIEGRAMYRHCLDRLIKAAEDFPDSRIFVVSQYREILNGISDHPQICGVYSPDSRNGISYTIRSGLNEVLRWSKDCGGVLFFTADQPLLKEETIRKFLNVIECEHPELASVCFGERPGNPGYFSRKYFGRLLELREDMGGRRIMMQDPGKIRYVEADEERELYDIDKMSEMLAISERDD